MRFFKSTTATMAFLALVFAQAAFAQDAKYTLEAGGHISLSSAGKLTFHRANGQTFDYSGYYVTFSPNKCWLGLAPKGGGEVMYFGPWLALHPQGGGAPRENPFCIQAAIQALQDTEPMVVPTCPECEAYIARQLDY